MNLLYADSVGTLTYVGYVLLAVIVLLIMITVHEFGHYITGKIFKFKIEEFAIGFGPKIFKKEKKDGEVFSIRLLPFGGYCAFYGEDNDKTEKGAFSLKPPFERLIVLLSGALMNYLFAILLISLMFGIYGQTSIVAGKIIDSPEYLSEESLKDGDILLRIEGKRIFLTSDIMNALSGRKKGDTVKITAINDGNVYEKKIKLREDAVFKSLEDVDSVYRVFGAYKITDGKINGQLFSTTIRTGFFDCLGAVFEFSFKICGMVFTVIGQLITGELGLSSIGGTFTTISVTANAVRVGGFNYLLYISSFIGINLAVFNLLPIPALDGARAVFVLFEWITKKPVNKKIESVVHTVGFILILLFAVLVDLQHCF